MLSKCANPACDAKLHYLHRGKIFRIDTESLGHASVRRKPVASVDPVLPRNGSRQVTQLEVAADRGGTFRPEYFWLCEECCGDWTIAVHGGSVVVVPVAEPVLLRAAAAS